MVSMLSAFMFALWFGGFLLHSSMVVVSFILLVVVSGILLVVVSMVVVSFILSVVVSIAVVCSS